MNEGQVIYRALIGGFAATLVFMALRVGDVAANPAHHPGGVAAAAPGAPAMAPGTPMGAPAAPPGAPGMVPSAPMGAPAALPGAPGMAPGAPMVAPSAPPSAPPGAPAAPGMAGGGMGEMMGPASPGGCMGGDCAPGGTKTPIYPSLMTLPALTPKKRAEIDALASQQINEGMERHTKGSESLNRATQAGDHAAMQQSVGMMREGLDELGAGIAARRVLSEGKAPRNLALDWFKREMNLASPIARENPRALFGVPPFHLFTIVLLIVFVLGMVVMYFFKMRRAADLFGRIEGGPGQSPPGSSPPLARTPAPPSAGTGPPPGGSPAAPASPEAPVVGTAPPAGTPTQPASATT